MRSNIIKKLISSALALSLIIGTGVILPQNTISVQAADYDDDRDDRDEVDVDDDRDDKYEIDIDNDKDDKYEIYIDNDKDDKYEIDVDNDRDDNDDDNINSIVNTKPAINPNKTAITEYFKTVYKNIFNREVDQEGLNFWVNHLATEQIELDEFFENLLVESEFLQVAPTVEDKIKKIYTGVFQREPDQGGLNFWINKYKQELAEEKNEKEALQEVIEEMTDGDEFKQILNRLGVRDND